MAVSTKALDNKVREQYLALIADFLAKNGEETLRTNSNEIAIPCVDEEGNDKFLVLTFKVPTGTREGEAYDGYAVAQDYALKVATKEAEAKKKAEEKAKKIARDAKNREKNKEK